MKRVFLIIGMLAVAAILYSALPLFANTREWLPLLANTREWVSSELGIASPGPTETSHQYLTAAIEKGELEQVVTVTGTLNAIVNVEVGSQLSGQISQLYVDFNDEVEKGQPLAQLDPKTFDARVREAEAAVNVTEMTIAVAKAKLERARIDVQNSEAQRAVLKARVDNARVQAAAAQTDVQRKQSLRDRQVSSAVELENATTKLASTTAALREAEAIAAAHENVIAGTRADVRRLEAELESEIASLPQKKASLRVAQIELERSTIRSPIKGVVVGRKVNEGQTLASALEAKTLFIIAGDLHQMEIDAKVDEADIGKIVVGQEATFTVDAHPGQRFSAAVRQVRKAPEVQQNVVTYTVVLAAPNPENVLLPGMTAMVKITTNKTGPVLKLPLAALRFAPASGPPERPKGTEVARGKPATIWLDRDGAVNPVVVGLGIDDGANAAILSGPVAAGDRIVIGDAGNASGPRRLFGIRIGL